MHRRDWLKRTSLALAGGLVLGDEVMEQYERLTHKKIWVLGEIRGRRVYQTVEFFYQGHFVGSFPAEDFKWMPTEVIYARV